MHSNNDQLVAQIRALYSRLHANTLTNDDVVDVSDVKFFDHTIYASQIYESVEVFDENFKQFKEPYSVFRAFPSDKVVLDIGAHWGYSVIAMRHQGCKSRIYSIEAMQANQKSLDTIKALDNGKYDWFNLAVGSEEGFLTFYIPMINGFPATGLASTGSTLDDFFADHLAGMVTEHPAKPSMFEGAVPENEIKLIVNKVKTTRIDTLLKSQNDLQKDVVAVKMDIEGHESFALQGAKNLFSNQKPLLMLEDANRNQRVAAVMMDYGYFHCEQKNGALHQHLAYSFANDGFWVHSDKIDEYRSLGIYEGDVPTAEEIAIPPKSDGVVRKGPAGQHNNKAAGAIHHAK